MGKVYHLKLIYDYIGGNDTLGYSIDELENDPIFMLQVMRMTKDKRMYELCSDTVKHDYLFVRDVIHLFQDDLEFVESVARGYLDSRDFPEDDLSVIELNIIMSSFFAREVNDFTLKALAFYEVERVKMYSCMNYTDDILLQRISKNGFYLTKCEYGTSDIIVDYIAKRMIGEVIYGDKYNHLEYLIHKQFKSIEDFQKYGEINFLREQIREFDSYLYDYSFHPVRLEKFEEFYASILKDIKRVELGWHSYMDRINTWRIDVFGCELSQYMIDNGIVGNLAYNDLISYVANKVGVVSIFERYDSDFVFQSDPSVYKVLGIDDVLCINKGIDLAKNLFYTDVIDIDYDDYCDKEDSEVAVDGNGKNPIIIKFPIANVRGKL